MNNISKTLDEIKTVSLNSMDLIVEYAQEMISEVSKKMSEEENELVHLNDLILMGKTSDHREAINLHSKAIETETRIEKLKKASNQLSAIDKALTSIANANSNVKAESILSLAERYYSELCVIHTNITNLGIKIKNDKISKIDSELEKVKATSLTAIELLLSNAQEMSSIVTDRLTAKKEQALKLETSIKEKVDNKDYSKVRTLSGKVIKITAKVRELEIAEEKLSKMDKSLTAIVNNSSKVELKSILNVINKYYGELCKVNVLLGNPVLKGNVAKKNDSKVKEALDALDVARKSLSNDDLDAAIKLVNALPDGKDKTDMQDQITEIENLIKNKEALDALDVARKSLNNDDLNAAIKLVNALPDGKDKTDMQNQVMEISNLIDNKAKFDEVKLLMDDAEAKVSKELWKKAEDKINALPDGTEKDELTERFKKLYNDNSDKVIKLLEEVEKEIKDNNDIITISKVKDLSIRYDIMVSSSLCAGIDKALEERVKNVIMYSNALTQEQKQVDEAKDPEKNGLKTRLIEFFGFPVNAICRSKIYGKVLKKKIEKAKEEKDTESVKKYEERNRERDIVSGVRLYKSLDDLSKLKAKLHGNGLSNFGSVRYNRVSNYASNKLASGLDKVLKKESDLILQDKVRTINVVNQSMEMLAIQDIKECTGAFGKIKKFFKKQTDQEVFDDRVSSVISLLDEAEKVGTLTPEEVLAYKEEIDNIAYYKSVYVNNSYKYIDSDIKDIMKNENSSLPYIKR